MMKMIAQQDITNFATIVQVLVNQ